MVWLWYSAEDSFPCSVVQFASHIIYLTGLFEDKMEEKRNCVGMSSLEGRQDTYHRSKPATYMDGRNSMCLHKHLHFSRRRKFGWIVREY